jgi:hypothetical protein
VGEKKMQSTGFYFDIFNICAGVKINHVYFLPICLMCDRAITPARIPNELHGSCFRVVRCEKQGIDITCFQLKRIIGWSCRGRTSSLTKLRMRSGELIKWFLDEKNLSNHYISSVCFTHFALHVGLHWCYLSKINMRC